MTSTLILVADPMCAWCYGFAPVLNELRSRMPELDATLLMGGLRPSPDRALASDETQLLRSEWERIARLTGQSFGARAPHMDDPAWVFDTEPASRAVVTVRCHDPELALSYCEALGRAFFGDGRDISRGDVLADIAEDFGLHREVFLDQWDSADMRQWTAEDFMRAETWGLKGFPALLLDHNEHLQAITLGYLPIDTLVARVSSILEAEHPGLPEAKGQ